MRRKFSNFCVSSAQTRRPGRLLHSKHVSQAHKRHKINAKFKLTKIDQHDDKWNVLKAHMLWTRQRAAVESIAVDAGNFRLFAPSVVEALGYFWSSSKCTCNSISKSSLLCELGVARRKMFSRFFRRRFPGNDVRLVQSHPHTTSSDYDEGEIWINESFSNSLNMLNNNGNTKRPKPSALHRSAVFEGRPPEVCAVRLVPSNAQLPPVDAQEGVISDVAVVDSVTELNNSQRHWGRSECESEQVLVLRECFVGQVLGELSELVDSCRSELRVLVALASFANKFAQFTCCRDSDIRGVVELRERRKMEIEIVFLSSDFPGQPLTGSGGTSSRVFVSHSDDCKSLSCSVWSTTAFASLIWSATINNAKRTSRFKRRRGAVPDEWNVKMWGLRRNPITVPLLPPVYLQLASE